MAPNTLPWPEVMRRSAALAALAWALVLSAGCTPRDPLDRTVEAHTLAELRVWIAETQRSVDHELAQEIELVFLNLASTTPRFRQPTTERELHQRGNALCKRVDGRRLRDVMIDSYTAAIDTLTLQNNIDAQNLVRLSSVVSTDRADAFNRRVDLVKTEIMRRDEQIVQHRARIEQLRKPRG